MANESARHEYKSGRFGDDGRCHAPISWWGHPSQRRCNRPRDEHQEGNDRG